MPNPICLHSLTVFLWMSRGCSSNPSSNTSLSALIAILTAFLNAIISKYASSVNGFLTNSDKFIAPNKQLPPAGSGSSAPHTVRINYFRTVRWTIAYDYYSRPSRLVSHGQAVSSFRPVPFIVRVPSQSERVLNPHVI